MPSSKAHPSSIQTGPGSDAVVPQLTGRRSTSSTVQFAHGDTQVELETQFTDAGSFSSNGSAVSTDLSEAASKTNLLAKGAGQWSAMTPVHEDSFGKDDHPHRRLQQASLAAAHRESQSSRQSAVSSYCSSGSDESYRSLPRWAIARASRSFTDLFKGVEGSTSILQHWRQFTLFGIPRDSCPRVWGANVHLTQRRGSVDSATEMPGVCKRRRRGSTVLNNMVKQHTYHDEMRLQLRDDSISLTYLDAFETDIDETGSRLIRVFSIGANLLEYLKILLSLWSFFAALAVASFWEVLHPLGSQGPLLYTDLCVDVVYVGCLFMQLRTTILDAETGRESCMPGKIINAHLTDLRFWLDIVSCVPLICLQHAAGAHARIALVKALRGWRVGRMPPQHRFVPSTSFLLFRLIVAIMMGGHLFACVWFTIVFEKEKTMLHYVPTRDRHMDMYFPQASRYESCVAQPAGCFWELYAVSGKQGVYLLLGIDMEAYSCFEHLFVALCSPIGAFLHAYILGKIILLIQRHGALGTKQNEHTLAIQEAMRILCLPPNLQMRIIAYFTYERIHRSGRLFHSLFKHLSPQLRFELSIHLYLDLVKKCGLFRKTRPRVIREIVMNLEDVIFMPGDWICRYGDYGDSMYFIVTGKCAVIDRDTVTELKFLERGAYFGEVALLTGVPRTAYVRANSYCIMAQLTKDGFSPIVRKWPEEIDVLISGVDNLIDRQKIKAEASKHYGLRRMSRISTTTAADTFAATQDPTYSGKTSCRSSMMVFCESPPPPMSMASTPSLLDRSGAAEGVGMACRSRHSVSGAVIRSSLRKGYPDASSRQNLEDDVPLTRKTSFATSICSSSSLLKRRLTSPACGVHSDAYDSEASNQKGFLPEVAARKVETAVLPLKSCSDHDVVEFLGARDDKQKCGNQHHVSLRASPEEDMPSESSTCSHGPEVHVTTSSDMSGQDAAFLRMESQLRDAVRHMTSLEEEVIKQRSFLTEHWDDMRQWTFEAVREVVQREVGNIHSSRRSSRSDDFMSLPDIDADHPSSISTPFT